MRTSALILCAGIMASSWAAANSEAGAVAPSNYFGRLAGPRRAPAFDTVARNLVDAAIEDADRNSPLLSRSALEDEENALVTAATGTTGAPLHADAPPMDESPAQAPLRAEAHSEKRNALVRHLVVAERSLHNKRIVTIVTDVRRQGHLDADRRYPTVPGPPPPVPVPTPWEHVVATSASRHHPHGSAAAATKGSHMVGVIIGVSVGLVSFGALVGACRAALVRFSPKEEVLPTTLPLATRHDGRATARWHSVHGPTDSELRTRSPSDSDGPAADEAADEAEAERTLRSLELLQFTAVGGRAAKWVAENEAMQPEPPPLSRSSGALPGSIGGFGLSPKTAAMFAPVVAPVAPPSSIPAAYAGGGGMDRDRLLGPSEEAQRLRMERFARALTMPAHADAVQYPKW
jgi:hypothetical protein